MAVYVDAAIWKWAGKLWCHMLADEIEELHGFAHKLAIKRSSYQGPPKTSAPHYDITGLERDRRYGLARSNAAARKSSRYFAGCG